MTHLLTAPRPDDSAALGPLQLRVWLQTYSDRAAGIDEAWIRRQRGSAATAQGVARWREFIEAAARRPDLMFCRVAREGTEIVGFVCGRRDGVVTLGPMYLLDEAQGHGLGGRMMEAFLTWAGDAAVHLWVTEFNTRAVRFYERHGFRTTGERELWRGRLPNVRMTRAAATSHEDRGRTVGDTESSDT
ncbi:MULTISPECIES: GNAT family N-acetyltransferase [unclassified Streptomyces]|uniref:GNAT family N-acetyltransferase n=1 Tax=unclassified Streptomyces TaxID=2593676 RepID=UPI002DD80A85|nr:GNAT family N-acetyltransferase [Streptomyces sp. NBC_01257]WRZ62813.1 GNAT family N-acetyltransferase [Streptomyces sp. NBC_01257]WSU56779.1 GNAT family N-acetyltransferase [Streptomyces sp. NBC_01104]